MGRVLSVANQKGGVGKSTTAVNLAVGLARAGRTVLLGDLDPQCRATQALGYAPVPHHAILAGRNAETGIVRTTTDGLDLVPGCRSFQDVFRLASGDEEGTHAMQSALEEAGATYDFVILDCPSSTGALTHLALMVSTEIVIPIHCEYFAMEGLTELIHVIRGVMQRTAGRLEFGGIVLTLYDHHLELTQEVDSEVREFFGDIVFETVIPRDALIAEAARVGRSVLDYAPRSRGARAYIELCMEVLDRD